MKKLIAIILSSILMMTVLPMGLFGISAFAQGVAVINGNETAIVDGEVEFIVNISGCAEATSIAVDVSFSDKFELVSGTWLLGDSMLKTFDTNTNKGAIAWSSQTDVNGDVFKLVLKATSASADLQSISVAVIARNNSTNVLNTTISKQIEISCATHNYGEYENTDPNKHAVVCADCGTVTEEAHDFDNACDTGCDICGYTRAASDHNYDGNGTECNNCGYLKPSYSEDLGFNSASVTIKQDLLINFKVEIEKFDADGYEEPFVKFEFDGKTMIVDVAAVQDGKYVFRLPNIAPDQMNVKIKATLHASKEGNNFISAVKEYSVSEYCYNMLEEYKDDTHSELRTLLVDMLNYGAYSQKYTGKGEDSLVNKDLTDEQRKWGTSEKPTYENKLNTKYEETEDPKVKWKGAGLTLTESVAIRFRFTFEFTSDVYIKVKTADNEWIFTSRTFLEEDGVYYINFDKLNVGQMSEEVFLTVYNGNGKVISDTLRYSIESYAYRMQNNSDSKLTELLQAMMMYGNAVCKYSQSQ